MILILIAGLSLVMIVLAQTIPPDASAGIADIDNITSVPPDATLVPMNNQDQYVEGELLVRFNPDKFVSDSAREVVSMKTHAQIGAYLINEFEGIPGLQLIRLPPGMGVHTGAVYYNSSPLVMYAEVNAIYSIANTPDRNISANPSPIGNETYGDLCVKYNTTAFPSPATLMVYANATNSAINATLVTDFTQYGMPGLQLVRLDTNMTKEEGIEYYQNITYVLFAEPDNEMKILMNQTTDQTISN
jgi:hypothetical protein